MKTPDQLRASAEVLRDMANLFERLATGEDLAAKDMAELPKTFDAPLYLRVSFEHLGKSYSLSPGLRTLFEEMLKKGDRLVAIKEVRTFVPTASLKAAKEFVENGCGGIGPTWEELTRAKEKAERERERAVRAEVERIRMESELAVIAEET